MHEINPKYSKLSPSERTPIDEMCNCKMPHPIVLVGNRVYNPLSCIICNGEVEPSSIGFDAELAEGLAFWLRLYRSVDYLWLDSGSYEDWTRDELLNI